MLNASALSEDPAANLQLALGVELAVPPLYLRALWSINPDADSALQSMAGRSLEVSDAAIFQAAAYMPVTRPLASGQARILELWNTCLPPPAKGEPRGRRG